MTTEFRSYPYRRGNWRCLIGLLAIALWAAPGVGAADPLRIVTTTSDLASIAGAITGGGAEVSSIANGKQDPHFLQAKPSYIMKARSADLWIRVGMELEIGWETPILDGARNPRIREGADGHLDVSEKVLRLEVPTRPITRAMGDVHPAGNPHYWLDPLNGRLIAESVAERLAQLAPGRREAFQRNLTTFTRELDTRMFGVALVNSVGGDQLWALLLNGQLDEWLRSQGLSEKLGGWHGALRPYRGSPILIYHRSWTYLANRFGLEIAGELEPKPGVPPSAGHLAAMVELVRGKGVKLILLEPFYNRKAADFVAARTGAAVVIAANSTGGSAQAADYLSMLDGVISQLQQVLQEE
jgi:ABC-type Zn uptake system ZnuABC Zn-binding protein ZnuA